MPNNYDLLASSNVTSAVNNITFSSIDQNYTDLVLHISAIKLDITGTPNNASFYVQVNSVTSGGLYSARVLRYNGSTISGGSSGSQSTGELTWSGDGITATYGNGGYVTFIQYKNTSVKKLAVGGGGNAAQSQGVDGTEGWGFHSTNAISEMKFYPQRGNFDVGTQLYLYGIKAA